MRAPSSDGTSRDHMKPAAKASGPRSQYAPYGACHLSKFARRTDGGAKLVFMLSPLSSRSAGSACIPKYELGCDRFAAWKFSRVVRSVSLFGAAGSSCVPLLRVTGAVSAEDSLTSLPPGRFSSLASLGLEYKLRIGRGVCSPRPIVRRAGLVTTSVHLPCILSQASFAICRIHVHPKKSEGP